MIGPVGAVLATPIKALAALPKRRCALGVQPVHALLFEHGHTHPLAWGQASPPWVVPRGRDTTPTPVSVTATFLQRVTIAFPFDNRERRPSMQPPETLEAQGRLGLVAPAEFMVPLEGHAQAHRRLTAVSVEVVLLQ